MKKVTYIIINFLVFLSCEENSDIMMQTLETYTNGRVTEMGAVIACAASDENTEDILTFYYPIKGVTDIRYYETINTEVENTKLSNYKRILLNREPFFNGYLEKFVQSASNEKWVIVTFEIENEIKISNPIRLKQISKPTVWSNDVVINQSQSGMPNFSWEDNSVGDNAIYFQVLSDENNNLFSGTYTYENQFQYYNTNNVVLNVTTQTPPDLILNRNYNFTLMDVSLDNWVNWVVQKSFIAE